MKKIEDFNYSICSDGRVYSHITNRFRKWGCNNRGYYSVVLYDGLGGHKQYLIHRLVAMAFIPNPEDLPCVNHKDGDKSNNHVSNLEWCSYLDNNEHALETGLRDPNKYKDIEKATTIIKYAMDGWRIKDIADALGMARSNVTHYLYSDSFEFIREDFDWENRPNKSATINDKTVITICELLEKGLSTKEIADMVGISRRKVYRIKKKEVYRLLSQNFNF